MTTYNTGNPIGSKDPRDLYDNAENLDTAVNDTSRDTWTDRLGKSRKTMSGMEREFNADQDDRDARFNSFIASSGYQFLGDYAAGIEITEYNQIVRDADGEFWRLSGEVELPYTTTGAGLPEGNSLTPLGDAVLRQDLDGDITLGQGATLIRGGVVHFSSPEDMRNLSAALIKNDQAATLDGLTYVYSDTAEDPTYWASGGGGWTLQNRNQLGLRYGEATEVPITDVEVVLGVAHGKLIGGSGTTLYVSNDGASWSSIGSSGFAVGSNQYSVHELADGEILINTGSELRKSSGWQTDPSTATFNIVQVSFTYPTGQARFHQGWGVRAAGQYVFATEYGNPKPQAFRSYLSTDYGATFNEVFNLSDHFTVDGSSNAHNHGCCIDPWHGSIPRLWQLSADAGFVGAHWSDDLGQTWNSIPLENAPLSATLGEIPNYCIVDATKYGMVFGSDDVPNGTAVIPRDGDYATNPKMYTAYVFKDNEENRLTHVAQSQVVIDGIVYTLLERSGSYPNMPSRIIATSVKTGQGVLLWESDAPTNLRKLDFYNGALIARNNEPENNYVSISLYSDSAIKNSSAEIADPGHVLGGSATGDRRNLAVGIGSEAQDSQSTAVGSNSKALSIGAVAVGAYTEAQGDSSVAIGGANISELAAKAATQGTAVGGRSESTGVASSALGFNASSDGANSLALGSNSSAAGSASIAVGGLASAGDTEGTAVGRSANASGNRAVALGASAESAGLRSIAVGCDASATANYTVALGEGAVASHNGSVAIGRGTETSSDFEVSIGGRSLLLGNSSAGTPPANTAALYVVDNDGVQELRVRFPNGVTKVIATD